MVRRCFAFMYKSFHVDWGKLYNHLHSRVTILLFINYYFLARFSNRYHLAFSFQIGCTATSVVICTESMVKISRTTTMTTTTTKTRRHVTTNRLLRPFTMATNYQHLQHLPNRTYRLTKPRHWSRNELWLGIRNRIVGRKKPTHGKWLASSAPNVVDGIRRRVRAIAIYDMSVAESHGNSVHSVRIARFTDRIWKSICNINTSLCQTIRVNCGVANIMCKKIGWKVCD